MTQGRRRAVEEHWGLRAGGGSLTQRPAARRTRAPRAPHPVLSRTPAGARDLARLGFPLDHVVSAPQPQTRVPVSQRRPDAPRVPARRRPGPAQRLQEELGRKCAEPS